MKKIKKIYALFSILLLKSTLILCSFNIDNNNNKDQELIEAINNKNINLVKQLLNKGANLYTRASKGQTPLHLVINIPINVEKNSVFNMDKKAIALNEQKKIKAIVKTLIHKIKDSKKKQDYINAKDHLGLNSLFYAIEKNYTDIAKILIKFGANVNCIYDKFKNIDSKYTKLTPLMIACLNENKELVQLLLENQANISQSFNIENNLLFKNKIFNNLDYNTLKLAYQSESLSIFKILLENGISFKDIENNLDYFLYHPNKILDLIKLLYLLYNSESVNEVETILDHSQSYQYTIFRFINNNNKFREKILNLNNNNINARILNILAFYLNLKQNQNNDIDQLYQLSDNSHYIYRNINIKKVKKDIRQTAKQILKNFN